MRVLEVVAGLHRIGGVTTFVGGLSNALVDQDVDVTIATYRTTGGADDFIPDSRVYVADARTVRIEAYDVVHVHGLWDRDVFWASGTALAHDLPLVWSPHGMLAPWSLKFKRWKKILPWHLYLKRRLKRANVLHVTAGNEAKWLREMGFHNRIEVVPLGVMVRNGDKWPEPEKRVLFVGRLHPVKGLENLMHAWALVQNENTSVPLGFSLNLVGIDDGGYQKTLIHLANQLGLDRTVNFLGPMYGEELEHEYQRSWVSVLPSFTENFGGVVIDSLANGCPVIASTNTPWGELTKRHCGWWVSNEPRVLAGAVLDAMRLSVEDRLRLVANGKDLVEESYTWQAVARKMRGVYESIAKR